MLNDQETKGGGGRQGAEVSGLTRMWALSCAIQLHPLLRPSAREDCQRYLANLTDEASIREWMIWATRVIEAQRRQPGSSPLSLAARLMASAPRGVFRRPQHAFRPRHRA
jgi:hypothetical protein